jgi:hypothetical protein
MEIAAGRLNPGSRTLKSCRWRWKTRDQRVVIVTGGRPGPVEEAIAEHANIAGLAADAASAEDAKRTWI